MRVAVAVLLALFLLLQYDLWVGEGSLATVWRLQSAVEEQRRENAVLAERNRSLDAEVTDLKQGLDAVEERVRSELGMVREGETFYRIVEAEKP